MWSKIKPYSKTILFITAIGLFLIGVSDYSSSTDIFDPFNEPSQYYFTLTFLIMFFLWKTNYFKRDKLQLIIMWNRFLYWCATLTVDGLYFDITYNRKHCIRVRLL